MISSANAFTSTSFTRLLSSTSKSLTYRSKRIGDIREPYGVPALKLICYSPSFSLMLENSNLIMFSVSSSIPASLHFTNSFSWLTLLKADLKSMKVA